MAVIYEVILTEQTGAVIAVVNDFKALRWSRRVNGVGEMAVTFSHDRFHPSLFAVDRRLQLWRKADNVDDQLIMVSFARYLRRHSINGLRVVSLKCPDSNYLLTGRTVASDSGLPGADKSGPADNVMKEYVDDAMGSGASASRILTASNFSVENDTGLAPSVEKSAQRLRLLTTLQELARSSANKGTKLRFDVANPTPSSFQFRTYVDQRGTDRTTGTNNNPVELSEELGTLTNPSIEQDWRDEITFVYGGGPGDGATRTIKTAEDTVRSAESVFARREGWYDGRNYTIEDALQSATEAALEVGKPKRRFTADLVDSENNRFGKHWGFGDRVTALYDEEQIDVEITAVKGTIAPEGKELITARLEYVD